MSRLALLAIDIVAVSILVFALYFPRHRRRDLVVAYLGVNIGVVAVASSLTMGNTTAGLGLGLGLFGVLSIIRLRSTELEQPEVSYYFSALALGILAALGESLLWYSTALMALVVLAMFVGDHPRLFGHHRREIVVLDRAITDHAALVAYLEHLLAARVRLANVQRLDLVNDTTVVDVRHSRPARRPATVGDVAVPAGSHK